MHVRFFRSEPRLTEPPSAPPALGVFEMLCVPRAGELVNLYLPAGEGTAVGSQWEVERVAHSVGDSTTTHPPHAILVVVKPWHDGPPPEMQISTESDIGAQIPTPPHRV